MFCNNCGTGNSVNARFCTKCGESLSNASEEQSFKDDMGFDPDNKEELKEYYAEAIGYKNAGYYLSQFDRFDSKGYTASWNWPAFFVSFYWLLYRKMWFWALLYFLLPIPLAILVAVLPPSFESAGVLAYVLYMFGILILFPMYANALYYRHLNKKILNAKKLFDNKQKRLKMVANEGGTSSIILIVMMLFVFIAIISILMAIAIPAYQDYTIRANVAQGILSGEKYKTKVETYVIQNQQWPQSITDIGGIESIADSNIGNISIENGAVVIEYAGIAQLNGKSLALIPSVNDENYIVWECTTIDIENIYLPVDCRE